MSQQVAIFFRTIQRFQNVLLIALHADVDLIIAAARTDLYMWSFVDASQVAFGAKMHAHPITCSCHLALSNNCELRVMTGDAEGGRG
jgi:hypothetical protein